MSNKKHQDDTEIMDQNVLFTVTGCRVVVDTLSHDGQQQKKNYNLHLMVTHLNGKEKKFSPFVNAGVPLNFKHVVDSQN